MDRPRYLAAGDSALVVEYGATAEPCFHDQVLALDAALAAQPIEGIRETVPTYRSLMIHFDPNRLRAEDLIRTLEDLSLCDVPSGERKIWRVPACYEPPHAEDLDELAKTLALAPDKIAELHAGANYRVVMYGFAPGFVFLSGLPHELNVSRRETPRAPAPSGALTVANGQALIASIAMPTGWYVLGRTPAKTFDPTRDPVFPIGIGDEVRFERIAAARFDELARAAEAGEPVIEAA